MQTVSRLPERASKAKEKAKTLRQSVNDHIDQLSKAIDLVRASEEFTEWLNFQSVFHDYSWGNTWLIASQCPKATHVAGFNTWKKLGRHVCKGQSGIMIFAPMVFKKTDTKTGEDKIGINFRSVYVFDVSQTDGEPIPSIECMDIESRNDKLLTDLIAVSNSRGIDLQFKTIEDGAFGYATRNNEIVIDNTKSTGQQAKTLAHELAHIAIHFNKGIQADRGPLTRSIAELEAESVAYIVCRHFGHDTEIRSSKYIAIWNGDSKALKASLNLIANTAKSIIVDITSATQSKAAA